MSFKILKKRVPYKPILPGFESTYRLTITKWEVTRTHSWLSQQSFGKVPLRNHTVVVSRCTEFFDLPSPFLGFLPSLAFHHHSTPTFTSTRLDGRRPVSIQLRVTHTQSGLFPQCSSRFRWPSWRYRIRLVGEPFGGDASLYTRVTKYLFALFRFFLMASCFMIVCSLFVLWVDGIFLLLISDWEDYGDGGRWAHNSCLTLRTVTPSRSNLLNPHASSLIPL